MVEKYNLTVKPFGTKKVKVQQELPSGRRIPYMKPLKFKQGGRITYPLTGQLKPAWMRNR